MGKKNRPKLNFFCLNKITIIEKFWLKRYQWLIYLKCRAGGIAPTSHLSGDVREFTYFLSEQTGQIDLDRPYSWVKCNNDFKGYYVTDYSLDQFSIFTSVIVNNQSVKKSSTKILCKRKKKDCWKYIIKEKNWLLFRFFQQAIEPI